MLTPTERKYLQSRDKAGYSKIYQRQIQLRIRKRVRQAYVDLALLERYRDQWDTKESILSDRNTYSDESKLGIIYSKRIRGKNITKALIKELQQQIE